MRPVFSLLILLALCHSSFGQIRVSSQGEGDYRTIQQAFDAIPRGNKKPVIIKVGNGIYKEKLWLDSTQKSITLIGEDKFNTIISFDDHTGKLSPRGDTINTYTSQTFMIRGDNFRAENISFENNAGFAAGQAVAVHAYGDKLIFKNCRFLGFQDVLFLSNPQSRQYFEDCYIEGTTDFIFGAATAWFERCHIHSKKNSHVTAASTPERKPYGFIFNDCILTGDSALAGVSLGRPWRPWASVTYLHCFIDKHILPAGWNNWKNPENEKTARFAEYESYGPGAGPAARLPWSRQLSEAEYRAINFNSVFGNWSPLK